MWHVCKITIYIFVNVLEGMHKKKFIKGNPVRSGYKIVYLAS